MTLLFFLSWWPSPQQLYSPLLTPQADMAFFTKQMRYPRFRAARTEVEATLHRLLQAKGLPGQPSRVFLRVFKQEKVLEVWVGQAESDTFALLKSYPVCALSGVLGPKRKQGDRQIPEGFYTIDRFNPASSYHLSLGLDYPNRSDRILGDKQDPGDDIFIHGNCVTIGCVPITDALIKEVYVLCVAARGNGQKQIPVHLFPARLTPSNLAGLIAERPQHEAFWRGLQDGYNYFETHRRLPKISVSENGAYSFQ